jgi:hypothetical protein
MMWQPGGGKWRGEGGGVGMRRERERRGGRKEKRRAGMRRERERERDRKEKGRVLADDSGVVVSDFDDVAVWKG